MNKIFTLLVIVVSLGLMGFGFYGTTPVSTFTPTGQLTISAVTTGSVSGVLGSTIASTPSATTAIVANMGSNPVYVLFGASNVAATTTNGFAVPASSVSLPLSIKGAGYAAAISTGGNTSVSISTGY